MKKKTVFAYHSFHKGLPTHRQFTEFRIRQFCLSPANMVNTLW